MNAHTPAFPHAASLAEPASLPRGDVAPVPQRILLVTDAWRPQVNGVVRTLERLAEELPGLGATPMFLTPDGFRTVGVPIYPSIRMALATPAAVGRRIDAAGADHVHIVTEGPLGLLARRHCLRIGRPFTTSYHTRFPEYLAARGVPVPRKWVQAGLRRFHNAAEATLVATQSMAEELRAAGFTRVKPWTRGVDTDQFRPELRSDLGLPRPVFLYVGRVAVEKNLEAFLDLDLPGTKLVVGDGPALAGLRQRYGSAHFAGEQSGATLARTYASSDVFVFPSRTETFGIVLLEALASGLPVAAFPVTGPADVLDDGLGGVLSEDLRTAALAALTTRREDARAKALRYSWRRCAEIFLETAAKSARWPVD